MTTALGIIDAQRGFMPVREGVRLEQEGFGELPVPEGDRIVPVVTGLLGAAAVLGWGVFRTFDWHPHETAHFSDSPDFKTTWPEHCVAGTPGAMGHQDIAILMPENTNMFFKGQAALLAGEDDDSYSGANGIDDNGETLVQWLKKQQVTKVILGGLALDYCVKATAIDLAEKADLDVTIVEDATRPVDPNYLVRHDDDLRVAGVSIIWSSTLLKDVRRA